MRQNKKGQGKAIMLTLHRNKPQQRQLRHDVSLTVRKYLQVGNQKKLLRSHLLLQPLVLHSRL